MQLPLTTRTCACYDLSVCAWRILTCWGEAAEAAAATSAREPPSKSSAALSCVALCCSSGREPGTSASVWMTATSCSGPSPAWGQLYSSAEAWYVQTLEVPARSMPRQSFETPYSALICDAWHGTPAATRCSLNRQCKGVLKVSMQAHRPFYTMDWRANAIHG